MLLGSALRVFLLQSLQSKFRYEEFWFFYRQYFFSLYVRICVSMLQIFFFASPENFILS